MQRRTLLKLGLGSLAALAVVGGSVSLVRPGLHGTVLAEGGRAVFASVGQAVLDGVLAPPGQARRTDVQALLGRIDVLVAGLPLHSRSELSQLLAVLQTAPGRRWLGGLERPWAEASVVEVQHALQGMRVSGLALRRQAYQAMHDIVGGAWFSEPGTWAQLGYPGPRAV